MQKGTVVRISSRWYVRYWERRNVNGSIQSKRVSHCLGPVVARGKHPPADITDAAEKHMATVSHGTIPPERIVSLGNFVEQVYLPWVLENKKPSTHHGYVSAWANHLQPMISRERISLKDLRTYNIQQWLDRIGEGNLSRNSLKRVQSFLSGVFKQAKRLGYYDGVNPAQDTAVNSRAAEPVDGYAHSLEEIQTILGILPEPAATMWAVASFAGLRRGEIEGLDWPDYHDGALHVARSVWNGRVGIPKTAMSCAAVPVIRQLAERLEMHRLRCGSPTAGPMFANSIGGRLNINNLLNRTMLPLFKKAGIAWRGWHSCRRGLGSNLYRLGVNDKTIQQILRHSNVNITLGYYVKTASPDVLAAMAKLEEKISVQSGLDIERTLNSDSGATPGFVN